LCGLLFRGRKDTVCRAGFVPTTGWKTTDARGVPGSDYGAEGKVREGYETWAVVLGSGQVTTGRITKQSDEEITLVSLAETQALRETVIHRDDIMTLSNSRRH